MTIYCDKDGVLADFDAGVKELTGMYPHQFSKVGHMWAQLARADEFFYNLPFMPDGEELWDAIKHLEPVILTGVPMGKWAPGQKIKWAGENLGWDVKIITCWSKEKHLHCQPGDILIDDREKLKAAWESAGGIFIHHTSTVETLAKLEELGVI